MADPDHTPILDGWDRLSVVVYRIALTVGALGTVAVGWSLWSGQEPVLAHRVATGAGALAAASVHLYDKRVRGVLLWVAVGGLAVARVPGLWGQAGQGLVYAALGILAFKEWFCFRLPGLRAVPFLLLVGVLVEAFAPGSERIAGGAFGAAGLLMTGMVVGKWRMPLGHDVGRKDAYQV